MFLTVKTGYLYQTKNQCFMNLKLKIWQKLPPYSSAEITIYFSQKFKSLPPHFFQQKLKISGNNQKSLCTPLKKIAETFSPKKNYYPSFQKTLISLSFSKKFPISYYS